MTRMVNIYIYIYIYILSYTGCSVVSEQFSVARHVGRLKRNQSNFVRLSTILLSQQVTHVSSGIIRHFLVAFVCLYVCLTGYQCLQFIRRALHYASSPVGERIYIYIYIY